MKTIRRTRIATALVMVAALVAAVLPLTGADSVTAPEPAGEQGLVAAPFDVELAGTITSRALLEASGMAVSRRSDKLLWMHNDSGARPGVWAVSSTGEVLGHVAVRGAVARDWEDMAAFDYQGRAMLMVADVGDNEARRNLAQLYFFEEPPVLADGLAADASVEVAWSIRFRFPEGAADCEAVAVDTANDQVLLLTKRQNPPQLFAVPLRPPEAAAADEVLTAVPLAAVATIPRPRAEDLLQDPMFGVYGSQPTAMDIVDRQLLVLTYRHAYLYTRAVDEDWSSAVARLPEIIVLPKLRQGESIAFDRLGANAYVSSEKRNAPIFRLVRRARPPAASSSPASG